MALKLSELAPANRGDSAALSKREADQIREAYHIILDQLDNPPSLVQLGRTVGLNRNKLNNGFREVFGDTVFNVLRKARMSKARALLQNSELSLPEIAYSVGYNSQANFTTAFRQHFGQTPNFVRQNGMLLR
jgi:AraC-like DNA-binding protein